MAAQRQLANALRELNKEPIEGFCVELTEDEDLFRWKIYLEGPQDSPYEGGIFQAIMKFPAEYPMLPPSLTFTSSFWHPNVYADGRVCISILHPPGEDPMSGELPEERWLPTQTVGTILLSVISMLNDPNTSSPANVDASVMWRNDRDAYNKKCAKLVAKANKEVPEGVVIPHPESNPEEKQKQLERKKALETPVDFFDDDDDSDEFFPDSNDDDDNSVISAFYDSDDGSAVEPLPVDDKSNSNDSVEEEKESNVPKVEEKSSNSNEEVPVDDVDSSAHTDSVSQKDDESSVDSTPVPATLEQAPISATETKEETKEEIKQEEPEQVAPVKQQAAEKNPSDVPSSKQGKKKSCTIM